MEEKLNKIIECDPGRTPGLDHTIIRIVFQEPYKINDMITYNPRYGEQLEIEAVVGNVHYCLYTRMDKDKFFPTDKLLPGIEYIHIGKRIVDIDSLFKSQK